MTSTSIVWQVRQAAPGGTAWTTLDSSSYEPWRDGMPLPGGYYPYATSIAVDAAGNLCVSGELVENVITPTIYSVNQTWFTRQYQAATGQWSTTDLFSYSTNMFSIALGATFAPGGSVFTVGTGTGDSGQRRWVVRKRGAPSPVALASALETEVNAMMARSALGRDPATVLLAIVGGIEADLEQGQSPSVCNRLRAFDNKVQQFVKQGILALSSGQLLTNWTDYLSLILGCPGRQAAKGRP